MTAQKFVIFFCFLPSESVLHSYTVPVFYWERNLGQVVYSHCLPSLPSSKKREFSDWTALTA